MAEGQEVSGGSAAAPMCANSCGFFGNAATKNLCSKCYKEHLINTADAAVAENGEKKIEVANKAAAAADKVVVLAADQPAAAQFSAAAATSIATTPAVEVKAAPANRCASCRKKVGLLGFACRCGGTFCSVHRYAEKHACEFDFKAEGREKIAMNNPIVVADKMIDKI